jgi:NAD(P)-dependent dehydrogenase (short-subunit alcohol dehydrogenase family)
MKLEAGQVAVVTGGASGLGLGLAHELARRGLSVVIGDIEPDPLGEAVSAVEAHGVKVLGMPTDVTDFDQVQALATATLERFGRVDVVCNNAGVASMGPFMWETPETDWRWVLSVNLGGVVNGVRAFVPHLVAQNSGHVVNTASMAAVSVTSRHTPYIASKFAVAGLTEALRRELDQAAPNVGVTTVFPGSMNTNIATADRNRPASLPPAPFEFTDEVMRDILEWADEISGPFMEPAVAAAIVVQAVEEGRLHVSPNGSISAVRSWIEPVLTDIEETGADS